MVLQRSIHPFSWVHSQQKQFWYKNYSNRNTAYSLLRGHDPFLNTPACSLVNLITICKTCMHTTTYLWNESKRREVQDAAQRNSATTSVLYLTIIILSSSYFYISRKIHLIMMLLWWLWRRIRKTVIKTMMMMALYCGKILLLHNKIKNTTPFKKNRRLIIMRAQHIISFRQTIQRNESTKQWRSVIIFIQIPAKRR